MLIKNARMAHTKELINITIKEGLLTQIIPVSKKQSEDPVSDALQGTVIDAGGNLVTPPFIDPHVHLDAVFMSDYIRPNLSGTLLEGIAVWGECKQKATKDLYKKHARNALTWYAAQGVLSVRSHVDTTAPGQKNVEALLEVRDELKHLMNIQLVAFPQDGIYTYAEGEKDLRRAMEMGCDVVGGIPHNEITREDGVRDVEYAFRLADEFGALVDIHCDETGDPQSRFVEVMAKETLVRDMGRRVAASHVTAMHNYDNDYAFKLNGIVARSGMSVITNPFDNTFLMNRNDGYPRRRGHTRVDELHARGVNVCIGHDSIMDPWYPLGQGSMLRAANLLLHTAHMTSAAQIEALFDMITINSAKAMGISGGYGIEVGKPADLVILDASTVFESLRLTPDPLFVIKNGEVISRTEPRTFKLTRGDREMTISLHQPQP
ncbi:MAG: amidohydrolase family protein [Bacteroidetes bacterium]|nr:amidohydrolase family protein [Bacteroidota bacterium]